jgi:SAM-dependent methyltransferase
MVCILICDYGRLAQSRYEGFDTTAAPVFDVRNDVVGIYDTFYSGIYDKLLFSDTKNSFELDELMKSKLDKRTSRVLDIGSGTGHQVNLLTKRGYRATGIDISKSMVDRASESFPGASYTVGDAANTMLFQQGSFSHIMCLYFTIYYIGDTQRFFSNCYSWLEPGGYILLHLVDRDKFDPVLPAGSPFVMVPPQKYAKERVLDTSVKFAKFQYTSKFEIDSATDRATLRETFVDDKTGSVRKHEHPMNMPTQKTILDMAKREGFILSSMRGMGETGYDHQYLYTLQRPV